MPQTFQPMHTICKSTLLSQITYACPVWIGFTSAEDKSRLQAIINEAEKWRLGGGIKLAALSTLCEAAEISFLQLQLQIVLMFCTNCCQRRNYPITI